MSAHPLETRKIHCREAYRTQGNQRFTELVHEALTFLDEHNTPVLDTSGNPILNDLQGLVDREGNDVYDSKYASLILLPAYVYEVIGKSPGRGKPGTVTPVNRFGFWELTWSMFNDLLKLEEHKQLDLRFDEEYQKPMYDILVTRNGKESMKFWELTGLAKALDNPREDHPNYNVDDDVALGKEGQGIVDEAWDTVVGVFDEKSGDCTSLGEMDKIQTLDQIRYILGRKEKTERALGRKPSMPGGDESEADTNREVGNTPEVEDNPNPGVDASEEDTNREEVKGFRRRSSRVAA